MKASYLASGAAALLITGCATPTPTNEASTEQTAQTVKIECKPIRDSRDRGGMCDNPALNVSGCPRPRTTCDSEIEESGSFNDGGRSSMSEVVRGMGSQ